MSKLFGVFVVTLFVTVLLGYMLVMQAAPVTIAQAQAAVITARSEARIDEMYAANNIAQITAARENHYTDVAIVTIIIAAIVIVIVFSFGAYSIGRAHRQGAISTGRVVKIGNRYFREFAEFDGAVIGLEPMSAPKGVLIDTRTTTDHL